MTLWLRSADAVLVPMICKYAVTTARRPPALFVLALVGRALSTSSTAEDDAARLAEEARLADEAADEERSLLVGAGCVLLLVVMFCAWLAVVSMYGYFYGFRPCSSVQDACQEGPVPAATDAACSSPTFTEPIKLGVAEPGDIFVAALPAKEPPSPFQLESELWKAPKDGEPPEEISQSWVAMAPLQTCSLDEPCNRIPATVGLEQNPLSNEGVKPGVAMVSTTAATRQVVSGTGRPPGCTMEDAEAVDSKIDDRDQTSMQPVGKATLPVEPRSPPPTSLCWNSCISLVCCSVASSATRAP